MLEPVLILVIIILVIILFFVVKKLVSLQENYEELKFLKASQSIKYGHLTEQWVPFSDKFPFSSQNFRFIGSPIDGLSFEDDKIVFVEFKTATSRLKEKQKQIKELVKKGRVKWFELRIK